MKMHESLHRSRPGYTRSSVGARRRRARLEVEYLEARVLLDATLLEDFEAPDLSAYTTIHRFYASALLAPDAAHDGAQGLLDVDGDDWIARADDAVQVAQGSTLSVWVKLANNADGRAYFGFGSKIPNVNQPLATGRTLSMVLAPNTDEMQLQLNNGFKFPPYNASGTTVLGTVAQTFVADHWYRMEVQWAVGGALTGNLYDEDGVTLLNTVTGTNTTVTSGGIAFRAFGSDKYWDTVTVDTGSRHPTAVHRGVAGFSDARGDLPFLPARPSPSLTGGPPATRDDIPLPFQYTSVPGTGVDIQLERLDLLSQVPNTGLIDGMVGLTYRNVSWNKGIYQYGWGPGMSGLDQVGTPQNSPDIQFYLYRQLPDDETRRIGESGLKRFYDSDQADFQFLPPGVMDTYRLSNFRQRYWGPVIDLDSGDMTINPATGERYNLDYLTTFPGKKDVNGVYTYLPRTYNSPIENLLVVNADDIDPAMNPPGTRWYHAGNIFVVGDQDVTNNSRWVEVVPHRNGDTFTFTYPAGSTGQLDIRTMPGLIPPGGGRNAGHGNGRPAATHGSTAAALFLAPTVQGLPATVSATPGALAAANAANVDQLFAAGAGDQPALSGVSHKVPDQAAGYHARTTPGHPELVDDLFAALPGG